MKKLFVLAFLLMASSVFAVSVDRSMPSTVAPSSQFTVSFTINPEGSLSSFDLADFVPQTWTLTEWSVTGYAKSDVTYDSQVTSYQNAQRNSLHWKFNAAFSSPVTLTYSMNAPASEGSYDMIATWIYSGGFNSKTSSLTVASQQPVQPPAQCATKYWLDNSNKDCGTRQFCGAYMYQGLQTFDTYDACVAAVRAQTQTGSPQPPQTGTTAQSSQPVNYTAIGLLVIVIIIAAGYFVWKRPKKKAR